MSAPHEPPARCCISSITSAGFSACICAGSNHAGLVISAPCSTQVEAFWSNSDQNGVVSPNTISRRSTARTPSTATSGCWPRARSSCIEVPMPNPVTAQTIAMQIAETTPSCGAVASEAAANTSPITNTMKPARPSPGRCVISAVRLTRRNECGSDAAVGGTITYFFRPIQNTIVAITISTPGIPNATFGP